MKADSMIPIITGVSQDSFIPDEDFDAVYEVVKRQLEKVRSQYPDSEVIMLTNLTPGAQLLCAQAAEEAGIPLIAALPADPVEFEKDLSKTDIDRFRHLCAYAKEVFTAPRTEKIPEGGVTKEDLYRQAELYTALHSHIIFETGSSLAREALNGGFCPVSGMPLRSNANTMIIHIPVSSDIHPEDIQISGNEQAVRAVLKETDEFNREAETVSLSGKHRLPEAPDDPALSRLEQVSLAAGKLSSQYAKKYRRVLALLAAAGTILTFSFLMYDEAQAIPMIFACGIMLVCAFTILRYASRSNCHRKYIEYRALAECVRVQVYLRYAGSSLQAADLLSWTQQDETAWIMCALFALSVSGAPKEAHDVSRCWVDEQRRYHEWAGRRAEKNNLISENTVRTAGIFSVLLYIAAVLFEILSGGVICTPVYPVTDAEIYRTALKILLGTLSAVTLFTAGYYGKLSLPRLAGDHEKMERFYAAVYKQMTHYGQTEELLALLAREELIENGSWCSYQRDNTPDINI